METTSSSVTGDEQFVETIFGDGPLGVTLRRRPEDGIVFVHEVILNSQAVNLDVQPDDELWAVADSEIGTTSLDKEAWNGLITFIKQSSRPLRLVWRRRPKEIDPNNVPQSDATSNLAELQNLVSRFAIKDKDSYRKIFMLDPSKLAIGGRRIIKQADLDVESKLSSNNNVFGSSAMKWSKASNKRRIVLCNDLLIVAILLTGNMLGVEYVLELATCKLRCLGHVFGVHNTFVNTDTTFDMIFPGGELQFTTFDVSYKDVWILNIYLAMTECVDVSSQGLGWRHQYLLGSMHSAVITRDEDRVRELISLCHNQQLDFYSIEAPDEDGYTPLHYACMLRLHAIVKLLHEATADVNVADRNGFTPLHWTAIQLDDYSLSLLSSHVLNIDFQDNHGRSPLVLACVEGRDLSGKTDSILLKRCIECLLSHKPDLHFCDSKGQTLIHYLAASWQYDGIECLLEADCSDVNATENRYFMSPLHYATRGSPIKLRIGDGMRVLSGLGGIGAAFSFGDDVNLQFEERNQVGAQETLRILLQFGAKPNQKDIQGRTPLMVILESTTLTKSEQECLISILLSHGARADDGTNALINNSQSAQLLLRTKFPDLNVAAFVEKWNMLPSLDCSKLNIRLNHFEPILEGDALGASGSHALAQSACSLCGYQFTLFRRQHHCRLCNMSSCDECSRKRVTVDGNQARACDCCYNRVLYAQKKMNKMEVLTNVQSTVDENGTVSNRLKREELLGSGRIVTKGKGEDRPSRNVASTVGVLHETHEQLFQRGEKLSQLSERSADMANQANEFARLAKQLNEQQKSRWF